jgi:hypothetical protein
MISFQKKLATSNHLPVALFLDLITAECCQASVNCRYFSFFAYSCEAGNSFYQGDASYLSQADLIAENLKVISKKPISY